MKNIKAVLFDFDGTLINTNRLVIESWQAAFKAIRGEEVDEAMLYAAFGEPLHISMAKFFPECPEKATKIYKDYQFGIFDTRVSVYPGMDDLVKKLKALGYMNAIVTSRIRQTTMYTLNLFEITKYFDEVVTCDDTEKHKPNPEPVLCALERLGISPDEAIMIGDSKYDIRCAHAAGVKAVLVEWSEAIQVQGTSKVEDLKEGDEEDGRGIPDFRINRAEQLIDILEQEK